MTDIATNTPELAAGTAVKGRSLWATALMRLRRNKAAMVSLLILILYIFAGISGPMLSPHHYATVYPEYVRVPASLEAYPRAEEIIPQAESVLTRTRLQIDAIEVNGNTLHVEASSEREIDPRMTRYLER